MFATLLTMSKNSGLSIAKADSRRRQKDHGDRRRGKTRRWLGLREGSEPSLHALIFFNPGVSTELANSGEKLLVKQDLHKNICIHFLILKDAFFNAAVLFLLSLLTMASDAKNPSLGATIESANALINIFKF
jgi:hypothetical protein